MLRSGVLSFFVMCGVSHVCVDDFGRILLEYVSRQILRRYISWLHFPSCLVLFCSFLCLFYRLREKIVLLI